MYLNVILTILTVTLITMTVLLTIWWRKYGKEMFSSVSKITGLNLNSDILKGMPSPGNVKDIFKNIKEMNQLLSKIKK